MKKSKLVMTIMFVSILGIAINSAIIAIPNIQATSDIDNNTQPSNQVVIQPELTRPETLVQSNNPQNPSIQESLQQQQQQQPLELKSGDQQVNKDNSSSQVNQNNFAPNIGDLSNICNPISGSCKPGY